MEQVQCRQLQEECKILAAELQSSREYEHIAIKECDELREELAYTNGKQVSIPVTSARSEHPMAGQERRADNDDDNDWDCCGMDAGNLFDTFSSVPPGPRSQFSSPRMRIADVGHLCETLRRHQGRGPTPAACRSGFAEFVISAVFGAEVSQVGKCDFMEMFPCLLANLEELEQEYSKKKVRRPINECLLTAVDV